MSGTEINLRMNDGAVRIFFPIGLSVSQYLRFEEAVQRALTLDDLRAAVESMERSTNQRAEVSRPRNGTGGKRVKRSA